VTADPRGSRASLDRRRVQRSAMRVGLLVGAASAIVITAGVLILVAVLVLTARPDGRPPGPDHPDGDRVVVDVDHILPWVIGLGILGVVLLGLIAWLAARWAVRPLTAALQLQRNFVSDAGHELRTPLTALTSRIQIVQRRLAKGEPVQDAIVELRRDAKTLDDVLADMLLTAEGGSAPDERADVGACVTAAVETLASLAAENHVTVETHVSGGPEARIPAVTLTRLCVALLDNAIGHTRTGTRVAVQARRSGHVVEIRVVDSGDGISARDADRIFERFARGAESGKRRGFGLGLALVREAATRYGGSVRIEGTSTSGTTFLLTLPAA